MAEDEADVRLYCRMAKISYQHGKSVYTHRRMSVPIPSRLQAAVEALLNKPLKIKIISKKDEVVIVLHPAKPFLHAKKPSAKSPPETRTPTSAQC